MIVIGVSDKGTLAGEALSPLVLNFKASHVHLLAGAPDPGGCDFSFPVPFSCRNARLFQLSTGLSRLSLPGSFSSVSSFRGLLSYAQA